MASSSEKDISYYRRFFVDPQKPIDPMFTNAATFLAQKLLGAPTPESSASTLPDGDFSNFVNKLAQRMQTSRHFDQNSMGQLHPNGFMPAILAHEASTMRNNNTVAIQSSPAETKMEQESIEWLISNIARYDNKDANGTFTVGGTLSNLSALFVARERFVHYSKWDGKSTITILTSEMTHYSVKKAARILAPGGLISTTPIPLEQNGYKADTQALKAKISELNAKNIPIMAIVAHAGQTETGLVDDLEEIASIAKENKIFLHVDGAYGAPFVLSRRGELFNGMESSDSLSVDPHKYLYTPYPGGVLMLRSSQDKDFINALNKEGEDYILGEIVGEHLGKGRLEGSMGGQGPAAALAVIKTLGTEGLKVVLDHTIDLTDHAYRTLSLPDSSFKPAYVPELNTIGFYPKDHNQRVDQWVEDAVVKLEEATGIYISTEILPVPSATVNSPENLIRSRVFRMVVSHPYTTHEIIENAIGSLEKIWNELIFSNTGQRRIY